MNLKSLIKNKYEGDLNRITIIDADYDKLYDGNSFFKLVTNAVSLFQSKSVKNVILISENSIELLAIFIASVLQDVRITLLSPRRDWDYDSVYSFESEQDTLVISDNDLLKGCSVAKISKMNSDLKLEIDTLNLKYFKVCIPTSATTGQSKIVIQSEENIVSNIYALKEHHFLTESSVVASCLPFFHVNALYFSFLSVFLSGGVTVFSRRFEPRGMLSSIAKYKVNIYSLIPLYLQKLNQYRNDLEIEKLNNLDYFVSAAAPLSIDTLRNFVIHFKKQVVQGYGLSEGVNFSCTLPIDLSSNEYEEIMYRYQYPSIGIALKDNDIKIIKSDGNLAEESEIGELWIKGKNIFSGYKLTDNDGLFDNGYFKTGDLGFYKNFKNKKFYFVSGRLKEVAKINGETNNLRDLDEFYKKNITSELDFFVTTLVHNQNGEVPILICKFDREESVNGFKLQYEKIMTCFPSNIRANFIFFTDREIRTASGKAKRWSFESEYMSFREVVYSYDDVITIIELANPNKNQKKT